MVQPTTPKFASWKLLRRKFDLVNDDPDWVGGNLDPDTYATVVVGGTASNGDYVIHLEGTDMYGNPVDEDITFTRGAGEANAAIATALEAEAQSLIDDGTLSSVLQDVSVNSTTITLEFQVDADIVVTVTDPGTATLTITGGDGKVTKGIGFFAPVNVSPRGRVEVRVFFCDASGNVVDVDQTTVTMTLEAIDVTREKLLGTSEIVAPLICNSVAEDDVPPQRPVFFDCSGSEGFTVRLSNISSEGGADHAIVMYREAV